jgi:hypothetical protein
MYDRDISEYQENISSDIIYDISNYTFSIIEPSLISSQEITPQKLNVDIFELSDDNSNPLLKYLLNDAESSSISDIYDSYDNISNRANTPLSEISIELEAELSNFHNIDIEYDKNENYKRDIIYIDDISNASDIYDIDISSNRSI